MSPKVLLCFWVAFFALFNVGCDDAPSNTSQARVDSSPVVDAAVDGAAAECEVEARRCDADAVEVCVSGAWQPLGPCSTGQACEAGECVCVPDCDRKVCGDDGCGGSCGACGEGESCAEGVCAQPPAECGDGTCGPTEDCGTCPTDCGQCCGDGVCNAVGGEDCSTCQADCGCGDAEACSNDGRCVVQCQPACDGRSCGADGCGGVCGGCDGGQICGDDGACQDRPAQCGDGMCGADESCSTCPIDCGQCCGDGECRPEHGEQCGTCLVDCGCADDERCDVGERSCVPACVPSCGGRECGSDGCGADCGSCNEDMVCGPGGGCQAAPAQCGDGVCDADEDCGTCSADCGQCCGDGQCEDGRGEHCGSCPVDCACEDAQRCDVAARNCVAACVPDCGGAVCGSDGCGGTCGQCGGGQICTVDRACDDPPAECGDGVCGDGEDCGTCPADCGNCCGDQVCDDARGESCGTCPIDCGCGVDERCDLAQQICELVCQPVCGGRECGADGCGGICGLCGEGQACDDPSGQCEAVCMPDCGGRACGPDGCGGECGACDEGAICADNGQCLGAGDGCVCENGELCLDGVCRLPGQLCGGQNPVGLCPSGLNCLAGDCTDQGGLCSLANPAGVCPLGELCRDGACEPLDDAALCDDNNPCTADVFDPVRNRCVHPAQAVACDDGNACTVNRCEVGVCLADPVDGCIEPPVLDPFVSPTNEGLLNLSGTKPQGAAVEINGQVAVPESPDQIWQVPLNLVPGENVYRVRSNDGGALSAEIVARVAYDIERPITRVSPPGGVFLSGITITVAATEPARIYYTTDGRTPDVQSRWFFATRTFRVFDTTRFRFRALDVAGNWEADEVDARFEITGDGNRWTPMGQLDQALSLAAVAGDGDLIYVIGGSDGGAPQAGAAVYTISDESWTVLPALQIARTQAAAVVVGGALYVLGGENEGIPLNIVERRNGAAWVAQRPMPTTRYGLTAVSSGNRIFAMGGKTNGGAVLDSFEIYDTGSNTWVADVVQMPRPRYAHGAVVRNGMIYLIGGEDENGVPIAEVDIYDIAANQWVEGPALPTPRAFVSVGYMENIGAVEGNHDGVVVAGGRLAGGAATAVVEELSLRDLVWRRRSSLPAPRYGAGTVTLAGADAVDSERIRLWMVGGQTAPEAGAARLTRSMVAYTHDLDYVRRIASMPSGRFLHAAESLDAHIYLFGGRNFQEMSELWRFDPETGSYAELPQLPSLQNGLVSATANGRVYAIGGANGFGLSVPTTRSYDPAEKRWFEHRPMPVARADAAATVLDDEIWVIGGDNNGVLQSVEIYNPQTDSWRAGPLLPQGRKGAMALTHEGTIWVIGGLDENGELLPSVLEIQGGEWVVQAGRIPVAYGYAAVTGQQRFSIFSGRAAAGPSPDLIRYDPGSRQVKNPWVNDSQLLLSRDRLAGTLHNGEIYLFGGNATPEVGPSGTADVQRVALRCLDGIRQPGEGAASNFPDDGFGCGNVGGCEGLNDPQAQALAQCRADGFTCEVVRNAVKGWTDSPGSDCSPADEWRVYCFADGVSNATCNLNCRVGDVRGGHFPCSCDVPPLYSHNWCEGYQ